MASAEVAVIGAGPIGIELAGALKQAGISYFQFDAAQIGSTIEWYPSQTAFHSTPDRIALCGVPFQTSTQARPTREDYLAYLRMVVELLDLRVRTYERVLAIEPQGMGFELRTQRRDGAGKYYANKVVLAIGNLHEPRRLGIPGEDLPHVSHYFRDPHPYFRQRLLVVGGRNSALEAALRCARAGAHVTLSYRRPALDPATVKPWLLIELRRLADAGRIKILPGTALAEISPGEAILYHTKLDRQTPCEQPNGCIKLNPDFVQLLTGYQQDTKLFEDLGIELVGPEQRPWIDPRTMETSVPGIYVAGTAMAGSPANKIRVIIESCHVHVQRIMAAIMGRPAADPKSAPLDDEAPSTLTASEGMPI